MKAVALQLPKIPLSDLKLWQLDVSYFFQTGFPPQFTDETQHPYAFVTFVRISARTESAGSVKDGTQGEVGYEALRVLVDKNCDPKETRVEKTKVYATLTR